MAAKPKPTSSLAPMAEVELPDATDDDRKAEAWLLVSTGTSRREVAKRFGVASTTIRNWTESYARARLSRPELVEIERERMIGQMEAVADKAWAGFNGVDGNAMVGPSYLKTIIEAAQVIIKLRGLDVPAERTGGGRETKVIVSFGGIPIHREQAGGIQGAIDVAVLEERAS